MYPSISHIEGLEVLRKQYGTHRKYQKNGRICIKIFFLSLISSFSNKYMEHVLVLNLPPPPYGCIFNGLH